jgi:UDPglucose 6-dehydrogenase
MFIVKSTVPPGTCRDLVRAVSGQLRVAANPEFLREGNAIEDALRPSRIVCGTDDQESVLMFTELYRDVGVPIVNTDTVTAELIKYASNSFLATKISFINEIATLCDAIGANVHTVAEGMGWDDRIGNKFLQPGPGFGGSCFPKDVRALRHLGRSVETPLRLLDAVLEVNTDRQHLSVERVRAMFGSLSGKHIAVWGLAFKPDTDDVRDAPALAVIASCCREGARVVAYDPFVKRLPSSFASVTHAPSAIDALHCADALIVMTDWPEFSSIHKVDIVSRVALNRIVDLRGVLRDTLMGEC